MRPRTVVAILLALAVVVSVSYLSNLNSELLTERFALSARSSLPVYLVLLSVFLLGFLPAVSALLAQGLKRDLEARRGRRQSREARSLEGSYRRAVDYQIDGQWGKAASELESLLKGRAESFGALVRYGEVLRHLGRAEEALEVHRKASVLYPQNVSILYQLTEDYEALGQLEVAKQIRDRILRDFPGVGVRVLRRRRNAALAGRDWKEASRLQERLEALLVEGGDRLELERERDVKRGLAYQRGEDLLQREQLDEARRIFQDILNEEPRFIPARILLGETALLSDDPDEALTIWQAGFYNTGSPVFLQRIEDHYIEREDPIEAIETLHHLIAASEADLLPRFFLGRLYYRLEMHDEAQRVLGELRERISPSPTFHFLLARIHERRGEMAKAVEELSACVAEAGITTQEFVCRVCRAKYSDWTDRCDGCGAWNSVEMDFKEERLTAEELGVQPAPIWAIYYEADAFRRDKAEDP
jgi:lipopolysaccharide biosynthesis regulator YciM